MSPRRAFTLAEISIVVAIIAVLASLAMPMLSITTRMAKRTSTLATMAKVQDALELFRDEIGTYPFQRTYADTAAGEAPGNDLQRRLGRTIATEDLRRLRRDADAAAGAYAYDCTDPANPTGPPAEQAPVGVHAFRMSDIQPASAAFQAGGGSVWTFDAASATWNPVWPRGGSYTSIATMKTAAAVMLNRMAAERARVAVFAGNAEVRGCRIAPVAAPDGRLFMPGRDSSGVALVASPESAGRPGWCGDYLAGELAKESVAGDAIVDAWRRPLAYVCQVVEGVHMPSGGTIFLAPLLQLDAAAYGLGTQGRSTARQRSSDRRSAAAPGFENTYEVWSSGPDGRLAWIRDDAVNRDNIAPRPYDLGLGD